MVFQEACNYFDMLNCAKELEISIFYYVSK